MDVAILWPICKQKARSMDHARAAFMLHAANDTAWTNEYGCGSDLIDAVGKLK